MITACYGDFWRRISIPKKKQSPPEDPGGLCISEPLKRLVGLTAKERRDLQLALVKPRVARNLAAMRIKIARSAPVRGGSPGRRMMCNACVRDRLRRTVVDMRSGERPVSDRRRGSRSRLPCRSLTRRRRGARGIAGIAAAEPGLGEALQKTHRTMGAFGRAWRELALDDRRQIFDPRHA